MCLIPASFKSAGVRRVYVCASVQSNQTNILFDVGDLLTQQGGIIGTGQPRSQAQITALSPRPGRKAEN